MSAGGEHLDAHDLTRHDAQMRTTLTLDADVARLIRDAMHRERKTFKDAVNDAIRRGLTPSPMREPREVYRVTPHVAALAPGYDRAGFNQLADELEDAAIVAKPVGRRR